jgi:hypothetical protein
MPVIIELVSFSGTQMTSGIFLTLFPLVLKTAIKINTKNNVRNKIVSIFTKAKYDCKAYLASFLEVNNCAKNGLSCEAFF